MSRKPAVFHVQLTDAIWASGLSGESLSWDRPHLVRLQPPEARGTMAARSSHLGAEALGVL